MNSRTKRLEVVDLLTAQQQLAKLGPVHTNEIITVETKITPIKARGA